MKNKSINNEKCICGLELYDKTNDKKIYNRKICNCKINNKILRVFFPSKPVFVKNYPYYPKELDLLYSTTHSTPFQRQ